MEPEALGCPRAWGLNLVLRHSDPRTGVFPLDDYGQGYDLSTAYRIGGRCTGEQHTGGFEAGWVEIFTVTDDCVVGRLLDTADALEAATGPIEGGFVALRCDQPG